MLNNAKILDNGNNVLSSQISKKNALKNRHSL